MNASTMLMCPKCQHEQHPANVECTQRGIVFEKYYRLQEPGKIKTTAMPMQLIAMTMDWQHCHTEPVQCSCLLLVSGAQLS